MLLAVVVRVVSHSSEQSLCALAACSRSIQPQYWRDLQDAFFAFHDSSFTVWKPALDSRNILLPHTSPSQLITHLLRTPTVLPNEHNPTRQPIQPITRQWVETVTPLCSHDLHHRVELVPARRVHWHTSWLVDHNHVLILMDYPNWLRSDWRLMPVERVRDYIAIFDDDARVNAWLAVDSDLSALNCVLVVPPVPVSELRGEYI